MAKFEIECEFILWVKWVVYRRIRKHGIQYRELSNEIDWWICYYLISWNDDIGKNGNNIKIVKLTKNRNSHAKKINKQW